MHPIIVRFVSRLHVSSGSPQSQLSDKRTVHSSPVEFPQAKLFHIVWSGVSKAFKSLSAHSLLSVRAPWTLHVEKLLCHQTLESMQSLRFCFSFLFFCLQSSPDHSSCVLQRTRRHAERLQHFKLASVVQMEGVFQASLLVYLLVLKSESLRGQQPDVGFWFCSTETQRTVILLIAWLSLCSFSFCTQANRQNTHFALFIIFCLSSDLTPIWFTLQSQTVLFYQLWF